MRESNIRSNYCYRLGGKIMISKKLLLLIIGGYVGIASALGIIYIYSGVITNNLVACIAGVALLLMAIIVIWYVVRKW